MKLVRVLSWILAGLLLLLVVGVAGAWVWARPATPDPFYRSVEPSGAPGTLLAVQPYSFDVPETAQAWLILYSTTRIDGSPAVASAVVMAPAGASGPLDMVAWAHGTTGIVSGCAPSVFAPFANVPAVSELLANGWAYVATDYVGLGTTGGHAYLVGEDAARAVLDSIRAASQMSEVDVSPRAVVWGHSQGGNSALWSGMMASSYAPDVEIAGVAGLAPASDMPSLIQSAQTGLFGKIVSSYVIAAYSATYQDVVAGDYVGWPSNWLAGDIAGRCVGGRETLFSVVETFMLPSGGIFGVDPTTGLLGDRLRQNVPSGPYGMPVLIGQGAVDDLVLEPVQADFVAGLCADGTTLAYQVYEGRDHVSLVAPDSPLTGPLVEWTRARFDGAVPDAGCGDP